ncbi:MAG: phosphatidylinositol mannoside acyltransferase [Actinomycetota bacterium]
MSGQGVTALYRLGALAARSLPNPVASVLPSIAAFPLSWVLTKKRTMVQRHMRRSLGPGHSDKAVKIAARKAFASYARYWIESFRLPTRSNKQLSRGIEVPDYRFVEEGLSRGNGVILALPHLGGWEWAGFWMATVNRLPITVVVEPIEPPQLFSWFVNFRSKLGMNVVPLGPSAGTEIAAALKRNEIVCLLCDRDISGGGIEVTFMGEPTTLPGGPALMALRTGAVVLPTAVYFEPNGKHLGLVRPPLDVSRSGTIKEDVVRVTSQLAQELEFLIRQDPEQWHLFQPNWPSDFADQT